MAQKIDINNRLGAIDGMIDRGEASLEVMIERQGLLKKLNDMVKNDALDCMQKIKLKWTVEGDENSKFFHGLLKRRRKQNTIQGIIVAVDWVTDPVRSNAELSNCRSDRFK